MHEPTDFLYLNAGNEWSGFTPTLEHGLEIAADGALRLASEQEGYVRRGVLRIGPFESVGNPWHRLRAFADLLPTGARVEIHAFDAAAGEAPYDPASETPFADPGWHAVPGGELDALVAPASRLWVGAVLRGDGSSTPVVRQMRLDGGRGRYLDSLPAIFGREEGPRDFLERFLALHGSVLEGLEEQISELPRLFDPAAAPSGEAPSWLAWLAGWLGFELSEGWSEVEAREYLAEAFELHGQRGTTQGLRRYLKLYAGVEAHVTEPGRRLDPWILGRGSALGLGTRLAPAQAQGAVLGTSAVVDGSHLTADDDFGEPLAEDSAHRFQVQVYAAELTRAQSQSDVRAVLEREKPAHASYHLCVIEPRLRVGVQARLGIDAIVAEGPAPARTGVRLGGGVLAASAVACGGGRVYSAGDLEPCDNEETI